MVQALTATTLPAASDRAALQRGGFRRNARYQDWCDIPHAMKRRRLLCRCYEAGLRPPHSIFTKPDLARLHSYCD
jgi:hypothetical protein